MQWRILLVLALASLGVPSLPSGAQSPDEPRPFQVCPCWLGPEELVGQVRGIHSEISFQCYLTTGRSSVEIFARSAGVGGPFRSYVYSAQPRAAVDARCRHFQSQPRERFATAQQLRTPAQSAACVSIVTAAASMLRCD